jgi:tRNA pseudouridine55 synthase
MLKTKHVGHCGTLDPGASGVLVMAIGEGTKLVPWLTADDKAYVTTVRLGITTDSLDAEGTETERVPLSQALEDGLATLEREGFEPSPLGAALATERQRTTQVPPIVSAIRIGGERAHVLARRGEAPELAARDVAVRGLNLLGGGMLPYPHVRLSIAVAKGYFVRSLARDLAQSLGTVGHVTALRRTQSGVFTLDDAANLEAPLEAIHAALLPLARAAGRALPASVISDEGVLAARRGQRLMPHQIRDPHGAASAWLDEAGTLIAIGTVDSDGGGRVLRGFPPR